MTPRPYPLVPGQGARPCRVMVVGTAPGPAETAVGRPFAGPTGEMLREVAEGILGKTIWYTNLVLTQSDERRGRPSLPDRDAGIKRLAREFDQRKPDLVIAVGSIPAQALTGLVLSLPRDHGNLFPVTYNDLRVAIVPIYDPAYVARRGGLLSQTGHEWVTDLESIRDMLERS